MVTVMVNLPCKVSRSPSLTSVLVKWILPPVGTFKLNFDGSSLSTDHAGGGRVLQDSLGSLILASVNRYGQATNMVVESRALLDGLHMCCVSGFLDICVESD
ncbi:hypothetical protein ACH5RR_012494 [Cinchona calisaya]|uniref:RNase H type-1 domain-containing protein n=1 Tax=Cinchona calisaya TaxID=153742 RepID=A0ABD3ADQ8_9GENT